MKSHELIQKLWNFCHVLRDDGITYHQYVTELTYLLFIKLLHETNQEHALPECYRWDQFISKQGEELRQFYDQLLADLGEHGDGLIRHIYANARSNISVPKNLEKLIRELNELDWYNAKIEGLGDIYEGLLAKNASEKKSGAGQYFTPRPLVNVMVQLIDPKPGERCNDPAAGTFGFMIAADRHVRAKTRNYQDLSLEQREFQQTKAFSGCELVSDTHRLALMNVLLHDLKSEIILGDSLAMRRESQMDVDVILTNPPFGAKKGGESPAREDLPFPSANKQLNFLQHIYHALKPNGRSRAAVIVPDNVLFQDGDAQKVRIDLLEKCNLHTILRLPTGIFYAPGVHTSVLFFTRGASDYGNTQEIWYYDLRSEMPSFGKKLPLREAHFAGFMEAYLASDRRSVKDPRWSCYTRKQIQENDENLDLGLLTFRGLNQLNRSPAALAEEAKDKLEQATGLLNELLIELKKRGERQTT